MVFSSLVFLFIFLPLTLTGYFLVNNALRNIFLLVASLFFYAWGETVYVSIMLCSIIFNYAWGHFVNRSFWGTTDVMPRVMLVAGVVINSSLLIYFKYAGFLTENINILLTKFSIEPIQVDTIHLPIGISFFTFQSLSYLVDVYRGDNKPQNNFFNCALYISLFPQLIAGPIVRYHDIARQIVSRVVTVKQFSLGTQRFIFGLAKKILIANPMGELADTIFNVPIDDITIGMSWLGIGCYSLQIYYDFSGYSDMAIGLGRMFGFEFLENFKYPYIAQSVQEFWRRWHISLSSWFRDYIYFPLGGSRLSAMRTYINLFVVFLLCGLWHGASWNFLIWGALHGVYLVIEKAGVHRVLLKFPRLFRHVYTLLLVMIAWVFFRTDTLTSALQYLKVMSGRANADGVVYYALYYIDKKAIIIFSTGCLIATPICQIITDFVKKYRIRRESRLIDRLIGYSYYFILFSLLFVAVSSLASGTYNPFIYFRF
ncbi:MAG: MBOAT family protein [Desulfobulbaceae bacterium]|nr:MBOAT family protein [Desulfobulbaceae bacterium]